jgi:hypothetical protein
MSPAARARRMLKAPPSAAIWMGAAAGAALALALSALTVAGPGGPGANLGLRLTARLGFLFFWSSYVGGALVTLFGEAFTPLKRRARLLGLAFVAVLAVHLGIVGWLCRIGQPPAAEIFVVFGLGAVWAALLALASIEPLGRAAGARGWWILRNIGMNYIAFDFALDFVRPLPGVTPLRLVEYLPFAALAVLGPALRLLAWLKIDLTADSHVDPAPLP